MLETSPNSSVAASRRISGLLVALGPVLMAALIFGAAPSFGGPMFYEPPTLMGVRHELVILALALGWGALGGYAVAKSRQRSSWVIPVATVLFTFPAVFAIVLTPAIVLILQNLVV